MSYALPILNFLINAFVLFRVTVLIFWYMEFEYIILELFFLFFMMVGFHGISHKIFQFMDEKKYFNLMSIAQFMASLLIIQLLGWLFSIYLAFVFMLIILVIQKKSEFFNFYLHMNGIIVGGLFAYINFIDSF